MKFKAIDLSLITPDDLRFRPRSLCEWPTVDINVVETPGHGGPEIV